MLAYLEGKVRAKGQGYLVLLAGPVGYKVQVTPGVYADHPVGAQAQLYLYHHVREDISALYGLATMAELEFFELLISVSGIGPKSALGVLSAASPEDLASAIAVGDSSVLTKVSGIGKKTAERIVLELRSKVAGLAPAGTMTAQSEEIDALVALGYSLAEAREALKMVDPAVVASSDRIREALKKMGR